MFSSTSVGNNVISLPAQLLSPCFDNEILLHRHHHHHNHHGCLTHVAPQLVETAAKEMKLSTNPEFHRPNKFNSKKKLGRKDRHSKIVTAKGPRDRRVRLSMGIAREFFDLQDLLGFDKASKTLDWLLTKSETPIKELLLMKHTTPDGPPKSLVSSSSSSECEQVVADQINGGSKRASSKRRRIIQGRPVLKCKAAKVPTNCIDQLLAKESRAKARERARERTKQKVWLRKLIGFEATTAKKSPDFLSPNQPRSWSHNVGSNCKTYSDHLSSTHNVMNAGLMDHDFFCFRPAGISGDQLVEMSNEKIFEESVMITRKMKPASSSIFGFQRNLLTSKEASSCSNFSHWPPINTTENWDFGSTITCCGLCASDDQHEFIKSTSTLREGFGFGGQRQQHYKHD